MANKYNEYVSGTAYSALKQKVFGELQRNAPSSTRTAGQPRDASDGALRAPRSLLPFQQKELIAPTYLDDISALSGDLMDQIRFRRILKDVKKGVADKVEYDPKTYFSQGLQREPTGKKSTQTPYDVKDEQVNSSKTENITLETKASDNSNKDLISLKYINTSSMMGDAKQIHQGELKSDQHLPDTALKGQLSESQQLEMNQEPQENAAQEQQHPSFEPLLQLSQSENPE